MKKKTLFLSLILSLIGVGLGLFFGLKCSPPPNLILISIDTLRSDRVGFYNPQAKTTPGMDRLAMESLIFTNTIVQSPWTLPSHMSLLTSLYPSTHKVGYAARVLDPSVVTLPGILRENGYATAAFVDAEFLSSRYGFARDFDIYLNTKGKGFTLVFPPARDWIKTRPSKPFFLFFHVFDCHCPYTPPEEIATLFSPDYQGELNLKGRCGIEGFPSDQLQDDDISYITQQYDGEIYSVDKGLQKLWDLLQKEGLLENSVIVITSDHGEEFFEHGRVGHTHSVYHELLKVPFLLRLPGLSPPAKRIDTPVRSIDIAPTLLDLAGIEVPGKMQGHTLVPLFSGEKTTRENETFSELNELEIKRSLIADGYQYILNREDNSEELYDLNQDPQEQINLASTHPQILKKMRIRMKKIENQATREGKDIQADEVDLSGKTLQELRALGYLH